MAETDPGLLDIWRATVLADARGVRVGDIEKRPASGTMAMRQLEMASDRVGSGASRNKTPRRRARVSDPEPCHIVRGSGLTAG